ncbi:MAG: hypothetical protein ACLFU3_09605 [Dichotomicrobium sp.]
MNVIARIEGVERRARRLRVPMYRLCVDAGVCQSNLIRWKQGGAPNLRVFERDLARLEAEVSRREAALLDELSREVKPGDDTMIRAGTAA